LPPRTKTFRPSATIKILVSLPIGASVVWSATITAQAASAARSLGKQSTAAKRWSWRAGLGSSRYQTFRRSAMPCQASRRAHGLGSAWVRLGHSTMSDQCPDYPCAVTRRRFPVGANPTRRTLQPEATGAAMEVTKWLKPSDSVSRNTVTARVCRPQRE